MPSTFFALQQAYISNAGVISGDVYLSGGALNIYDAIDYGRVRGTIYLSSRPSIVNGDARDDRIVGGTWGDTISGGAGDDIIDAGRGFNVIDGGSGADEIVIAGGSNRLVY